MAQRITRLTTDQKIAGSNPAEIEIFFSYFQINLDKMFAPPGGLEPPTFRLTAERANRLRHRDKAMNKICVVKCGFSQTRFCVWQNAATIQFLIQDK